MNDKKDSFADRLNRLFNEVRKSDGSRFTQTEVVEGTGGVLTRVYLWKLRMGKAVNPGYQIIQALASFFGVDPSYFFEGEPEGAEATGQTESRDLSKRIALRAGELDEEGKQTILNMIDYILEQRNKGSKKK